jgi:hypothetical protein
VLFAWPGGAATHLRRAGFRTRTRALPHAHPCARARCGRALLYVPAWMHCFYAPVVSRACCFTCCHAPALWRQMGLHVAGCAGCAGRCRRRDVGQGRRARRARRPRRPRRASPRTEPRRHRYNGGHGGPARAEQPRPHRDLNRTVTCET